MLELISETTLTVRGLGAIFIIFALVMGGIDLTIKVAKRGARDINYIYRRLNAKKIHEDRKARLFCMVQKKEREG